jgi:hypothetical protein
MEIPILEMQLPSRRAGQAEQHFTTPMKHSIVSLNSGGS